MTNFNLMILAAGYGKRMKNLTKFKPKPLLKINNKELLRNNIDFFLSLGCKKIVINTHYLNEQIDNFIQDFYADKYIQLIYEPTFLNTGGGILNMINNSDDKDFLIFNPDTLWKKNYLEEIIKMEELYFSDKIENILLLVNKNLSFDKNLMGDFNLENNLVLKNKKNELIYIGCQILNKKLLLDYNVENFSIVNVWNNLIKKNKLFGFESFNNFYHLTDLKTFKKLKDL